MAAHGLCPRQAPGARRQTRHGRSRLATNGRQLSRPCHNAALWRLRSRSLERTAPLPPPKKLSKNGDQIQRLFLSAAEILIVQYHSQIDQSLGATNHYRVEGIQRRHFIETAGAAGFSKPAIESAK